MHRRSSRADQSQQDQCDDRPKPCLDGDEHPRGGVHLGKVGGNGHRSSPSDPTLCRDGLVVADRVTPRHPLVVRRPGRRRLVPAVSCQSRGDRKTDPSLVSRSSDRRQRAVVSPSLSGLPDQSPVLQRGRPSSTATDEVSAEPQFDRQPNLDVTPINRGLGGHTGPLRHAWDRPAATSRKDRTVGRTTAPLTASQWTISPAPPPALLASPCRRGHQKPPNHGVAAFAPELTSVPLGRGCRGVDLFIRASGFI